MRVLSLGMQFLLSARGTRPDPSVLGASLGTTLIPGARAFRSKCCFHVSFFLWAGAGGGGDNVGHLELIPGSQCICAGLCRSWLAGCRLDTIRVRKRPVFVFKMPGRARRVGPGRGGVRGTLPSALCTAYLLLRERDGPSPLLCVPRASCLTRECVCF